jgi:hypothetical protein
MRLIEVKATSLNCYPSQRVVFDADRVTHLVCATQGSDPKTNICLSGGGFVQAAMSLDDVVELIKPKDTWPPQWPYSIPGIGPPGPYFVTIDRGDLPGEEPTNP